MSEAPTGGPKTRIRPADRRQAGLPIWVLSRGAGVVAGTRPPNLFLTLAKHRRLFWGWLRFAARLMPRGRLPRRETELVILRVAHLCDCSYEFDHHRRLGRRAGLHAEDVERIVAGPDAAGWSPRERALLAAADMLVRDHDLDDETWVRLRAQLSEPLMIEFLMLVGHYQMLATTINTLRIEPDRPRGA